ncbi:LysR family transcriptional regulator [Mangrovibacter sp. MFB070]|uniref:LysR substrate-binding domain-containing protein n=1 Tax=Mangrovibacter sp. MFB070 TaxID=1224318 RepID=UPI0004D4C66D|nr:LysR substrate-binding domain-containing protein [Mangrovibacter sp. MFB070]KEA50975.1 LysR family transcriptional regulator [Mangrovibacter sp. MFB070]
MENYGHFMQRIRLRHLHTFVAVAQQGTLGRAAQTLNLSQPALSKTLNELENLIGVRLLERGRMGAHLTPTGEQFLTHALRILDALQAAGHSLHSATQGEPQTVRLGALPTALLGLLPAVIGQFHRHQIGVSLQVAAMNNTMILSGLKSGELDFGIGRMSDPELMGGLSYELLFLESLRLVVHPGHPLLNETLTFRRILDWPAVVLPEGTPPRDRTEALLKEQGCTLSPCHVETLSASLSRQLAIDYDYVWFVPSGAVKEDLKTGVLVSLPVAIPGNGEPVGILTRVDTPLSVHAVTLINAIRQTIA